MKTKKIIIPVYYAEIDGKKVVDEDSIREEFEAKSKEVIKAIDYEKKTEKKPTCDVCGSEKDLIFIEGTNTGFNICQVCYEDILKNEEKVKEFL